MQRDLGHQPRRGEPPVVRGRDQKAQQSLQVQRVGRAADRELRRCVCGGPVARRVTQRAVKGDALLTEPLDRQPDRQPFAFLPDKAEGAVAAIGGLFRPVALGGIALDQIGKDPRQDHENRIGDARHKLGAERAVVEPCPLVGQRLRLAAEKFPPDNQPKPRGEHDRSETEDGKPDRPGAAAPRGRQRERRGIGHQKVFRYSTIASLSAAGSSVP